MLHAGQKLNDSETDFLPGLSLVASGIRHYFFFGGGAVEVLPENNLNFNFAL